MKVRWTKKGSDVMEDFRKYDGESIFSIEIVPDEDGNKDDENVSDEDEDNGGDE